jgi:hypothetical protein
MTASTTTSAPVAKPPAPHWSVARLLSVVFGGVAAALGIALLVTGGVFVAVGTSDGYLTDGEASLQSAGHAAVVHEIGVHGRVPDFGTDGALANLRVRATAEDAATPLFVGIGPRADVDRYLDGVAHDEVRDFEVAPFRVDYRRHAGGAPATEPGDQSFWVAADAGTGSRELDWDVTRGDYAVVVMNADGSAGVGATVDVGATVPVLRPVGIGFLAFGGLALVTGVVLVVAGARGPRRSPYTAVPVAPSR